MTDDSGGWRTVELTIRVTARVRSYHALEDLYLYADADDLVSAETGLVVSSASFDCETIGAIEK